MTLKVVGRPPALTEISELSDIQPPAFKNYQRWVIHRQVDGTTDSPVFHLIDPHGQKHIIKEYLIEDLEPEFADRLTELKTPQEQQEQVCHYLQKRLNEATSYNLHIEQYHNLRFLRFGDYGLKGGGDEKQDGEKKVVPSTQSNFRNNRFVGCFFCIILVGSGLILRRSKNRFAKLGSSMLMSAGYTSGKYLLSTQTYQGRECLKRAAYGVLTGGVSAGVFGICISTKIGKVWSQMLGAGIGRVTSAMTFELVQNEQMPAAGTLAKEFCIGTFVEGVGIGANEAVGRLMQDLSNLFIKGKEGISSQEIMPLMNSLNQNCSRDTVSLIYHLLTKFMQGSAGWAGHQITLNMLTKDEKGNRKPLFEEVFIPSLLAGLVNGGMCFSEALIKWNEFRKVRQDIKDAIRTFKIEMKKYGTPRNWPIASNQLKLLFHIDNIDKFVDQIGVKFKDTNILDKDQIDYLESELLHAEVLMGGVKSFGVRAFDGFISFKLHYFRSLKNLCREFYLIKTCPGSTCAGEVTVTPVDFLLTNGPLLEALQTYRTPYLKILGEFKKNPSIVQNHVRFAAGIKTIEDLEHAVVMEAFEVYQNTPDPDGLHINEFHEAIGADLFSLFYQKSPEEQGKINLSPGDVKIMICKDRDFLKKTISNISKFLKCNDENQRKGALELLNTYNLRLDKYLGYVETTQQKIQKFSETPQSSSDSKNSLTSESFAKAQAKWNEWRSIAQGEWKHVEIPSNIEFDLGKKWDLSEALRSYIAKIRLAFPKSSEELQELYQQLSCLHSETQQDQYQLNIVLSLILWSFKESEYLELMKNGKE